ncbi:MAG: HD domain-containing protein [Longimicrobiales bacterium]
MSHSLALPGVSVVELASLLVAAGRSLRPDQVEESVGFDSARIPNVGLAPAGAIPAEWLRWLDERSLAGAGHGQRVAQVCAALADCLPSTEVDLDELLMAAQVHEIGVLSGEASDPIELAWRGADLVADLGYPRGVAHMVRHMHERWDGLGGPSQWRRHTIPLGCSILSLADSIDHSAAAWIQAGVAPRDAVDRAVGHVVTKQASMFIPGVVHAATQVRAAIRSACGVPRTRLLAGLSSAGRRVYTTIATTLLGRLS